MKIGIRGFSVLIALVVLGGVEVQAQSRLRLSGQTLRVNGQDSIPKGLFGVHAGNFPGLNAQVVQDWGIESVRIIETVPSGNVMAPGGVVPAGVPQVVQCWFDRFVPARTVTAPNTWRTEFYTKATSYANQLPNQNHEAILEFWNEPYLNWAYKPGVNTDPQYFDTLNVADGDSVRLRGRSDFVRHLVWRRAQWYRSTRWASNTAGLYNAISQAWNAQLTARNIPYPGLTGALLPGETYYPGTNREFTVIERLRPVDESQSSFYSSYANARHYFAMLRVTADTLHRLAPQAKLSAGWGFEAHKDNWTPWPSLFKPLIDQFHSHLFSLHEHHYGMDARIIGLDYETMGAYAQSRYGTQLRFQNTETGGYADPQRPNQPGNSTASNLSALGKGLQAYTFHVRELIYLLDRVPDRAYSRAIHEPQNSFGGAEQALRMLKPLRGALLDGATDDDSLYWVGSLAQNGQRVVLALFNDRRHSQSVELNIDLPAGATVQSAFVRQIDTSQNALQTVDATLPSTQTGATWSHTLTLESGGARLLWLDLSNAPTTWQAQNRSLHYADTVLLTIPPGSQRTVTILISAGELASAGSARLRLGLMNHAGQAQVRLNGQPITYTDQGGDSWLSRGGVSLASIPVSQLQTQNTLEIRTLADSAQLWVACIELTDRPALLSVPSRAVSAKTLRMFPNPASQQVGVWSESEEPIVLYNALGAWVKTVPATSGLVSVPLSGLALGLYQVRQGMYCAPLVVE